MLQVSHLFADYAGKPALEDINLTLDSGELLVVLGPSGCGKTTLLNLIAGFLPYQHGTIQLAGKRVDKFLIAVLRYRAGHRADNGHFDILSKRHIAQRQGDTSCQ